MDRNTQPAARELEVTEIPLTAQGLGRTVNTPAGTQSVYFHNGLSEPELVALDAQFAAVTNGLAARNADGITGKALMADKAVEFTKLKPFVGKAISAIRSKRENLQLRRARMLSPNMNAEPNSQLRSDLRGWFAAQSVPQRIKMLTDCDYDLAVSVLEAGQASAGVDNSIWSAFEDHAAKLVHIRNAGLDSAFALKSTPENITAAGTDKAAVMAAADAALKQYYLDGELLDLAESYLQAVVRATMLVFNVSFDEVVF